MKTGRPLRERTISLVMFLVRTFPRWMGPPVAVGLGKIFARLRPAERQIVESNLAVVLGTDNRRRLRRIASKALGNAALAYYELFSLSTLSLKKIAAVVSMDEPGWSEFEAAHRRGKGVLVVSPHLSSYDLAGQSISARGFSVSVLVLPGQVEGMAFANWKRTSRGSRVFPLSAQSLREIMRYLHDGGVIVTGGERAVRGQGIKVDFFGRPTVLPDGLARLALSTDTALVGAACRRERHKYRVLFERIDFTRGADREADAREITQRLARFMEKAIRRHPEQWHLIHRLWD